MAEEVMGGRCSEDSDKEAACDVGANPFSGFACHFARFRRASLEVCPPGTKINFYECELATGTHGTVL